ncbi:MAG: DNA-directed RNA polymerase subunit beta [Anaerolineaceae bacterium 4572_78]|nr:MAG: DNA-directed RNA polymerase subunit beta [Anaerolineaceae bacterium 4572_78]
MANLSKKVYSRIDNVLELPRLIEVQLNSFKWFAMEGLKELFKEISPIVSFNKNLELSFLDHRFGEPKYEESECRQRDITYANPLWVQVRLVNKETGEISEQEVFMGDFPRMTKNATFIVNGAERVVVSQLIRSPGVYFAVTEDRSTGRNLATAKLIPNRGAWLEFETSKRDLISVKVDRKRKLPVTILLRVIGFATDEEILELFEDVDTNINHPYIASSIEKDPTKDEEGALIEFYKRLRPGDPPTLDNATTFIQSLFFSPRRYDLGKVGRYKLNHNLGSDIPQEQRILTQEDLIKVLRRIININNGKKQPDDIDHLGNRRVKTVGELIQNQLRIGLLRMERVVKERMSLKDPEDITPVSLINIRPVIATLREFFGGSQLSQFMQQTNPLDELTHKRTLSALGPGGLRRERAGFDVRDVHHSHYGRICPIETPEGPNIGLIGRLASYAKVNEYGFVETPYRKVIKSIKANNVESLINKTLRQDVYDLETGEVIAEHGTVIEKTLAKKIVDLDLKNPIKIRPMIIKRVDYLSAYDEDLHTIAQAQTDIDEHGQFVQDRVEARKGKITGFEPTINIDYIDVSPKQIVGISAALIPFLEHDDANRALMGSNMQRQAVPLLRPDAPCVGTGMEPYAARDSGQVLISQHDGEVISITSKHILIQEETGAIHDYEMRKFGRTNQSTCIDQRPIVYKGEYVKVGQILADSSSTEQGDLALGQDVLVGFLSWEGGNYEDAIIISQELIKADKFTSIHVEKHEVEARDTKLGPEDITRDIPNIGEESLKDLDEQGIIRVGAEVGPGDILVGKITPKGETELTPEEKLLRAIFGEKAREVKDSSLRLPHGDRGIVVDVQEFSREEYRDLAAGVEQMVRVMIAQKRKLREGDKMAGRHGNKGVISQIVPVEDMPYLEDGTPIEIILNPLGVPARMNIGQILETHLGFAARRLGFRAVTPVFDGAHESEIQEELARAWLMDRAWLKVTEETWEWIAEQGFAEEELRDEEECRQLYLIDALDGQGYDENKIVTDEQYARHAAVSYWLTKEGYDVKHILSDSNGMSKDIVRITCLREWLVSLQEQYHVSRDLRYSQTMENLDIDALSNEDVDRTAILVSRETGLSMPTTGKVKLYNGKTGKPYDTAVTVGVIHMLKLAHLVEDKVHARSTGPYSLVTQQPLGGKAQFGGQRFGEMEVWALEAYGAAHTLQEMLTVKSDDVTGRVKTYEAIVRGESIQDPGVPESFRVLVKELQSLGLAVEVFADGDESITFGKEEHKDRFPKLGLGLGIPGSRR